MHARVTGGQLVLHATAGAHNQPEELVNDGPVTLILDV